MNMFVYETITSVRRWQYSLRCLFGVVTLFAILSAIVTTIPDPLRAHLVGAFASLGSFLLVFLGPSLVLLPVLRHSARELDDHRH